ncbi:oxygen-insensitive NADPH nitroreductase [Psychromonas sp. MME2]|uniref:oxygen-insensitive NADPH nitroreductase n=1 Tax=unclassified Psychromonas TaxID=2614957 RepID=UPI00339D0370
MNDIISLLQSHRSIRRFSEKNVPQKTVETLVQAGQAAATSSFIQACTVIQIAPGEKRNKLAELAGNQPYVANAPVFLVFCADMHRHQLACEMHGETMQSGYTEQFLTASVDTALFAQNLVIAAESLGLGSCYIGGIRNEIEQVTNLLALPELVYPVFGLCLGYPDQNHEIKPRLPLSIVLKQESYDAPNDVAELAVYDQQIQRYYQTRSAGQKTTNWTAQIATMLQKEARPHMLPFLKQQGFIIK